MALQEKTRAAMAARAASADDDERIRTRFLGKARAKAETRSAASNGAGGETPPGASQEAAEEPDSADEEDSVEGVVDRVPVVPAVATQVAPRLSTFPPELSASEIYKAESAFNFSACNRGKGLGWAYAWLHRRGRLDAGCGDGGVDLVVREEGALPCVLLSGAHSLSQVAWAPDGDGFAIQCDRELLHICLQGVMANVSTWLRLPADEEFVGSPVWIGASAVLFATSGGSPKRHRLFAMEEPPPVAAAGGPAAAPGRMQLFEAGKGCELLSWEQSPTLPLVALVHRLANAALAQVILLQDPSSASSASQSPPEDQAGSIQRVVAIDGRVEYCKPQLAFLADGRLVARLNLVSGPISDLDTSLAQPPAATHGLWMLSDLSSSSPEWEPIKVRGDVPHGSYDVFSGSYAGGMPGEGFVLDTAREVVVVTTRKQSVETVADELWLVRLAGGDAKSGASGQRVALPAEPECKGCHVPVALSGSTLIYHFRSPTEWGDLWRVELPAEGPSNPIRLTSTMPQSLRLKLSTPEEIVVPNGRDGCHALLFRPSRPSSEPMQPLVWVHGGPSSMYAYDYNPLLNWLANLGYLVCVPNFRGSVGFGLDYMDSVLGDGCGVVDHLDCVACASYLRELGKEDPQIDLRRGVGVAGHSWGGYLTLMCMLRGGGEGKEEERPFSCGVASASITDFVKQQRATEVRYFDYALMGGWVYEPAVAARAARASPVTHAAGLRGPLLVLHGEEDRDVPFEQIGPFVEAAKRAPHPLASVACVTYPGCGHGVRGWNCKAQSDLLRQMRDFLRVNLKPWDFTDNPHGELATY